MLQWLLCKITGHLWGPTSTFSGGVEYHCVRCGAHHISFVGCPSYNPLDDKVLLKGRVLAKSTITGLPAYFCAINGTRCFKHYLPTERREYIAIGRSLLGERRDILTSPEGLISGLRKGIFSMRDCSTCRHKLACLVDQTVDKKYEKRDEIAFQAGIDGQNQQHEASKPE